MCLNQQSAALGHRYYWNCFYLSSSNLSTHSLQCLITHLQFTHLKSQYNKQACGFLTTCSNVLLHIPHGFPFPAQSTFKTVYLCKSAFIDRELDRQKISWSLVALKTSKAKLFLFVWFTQGRVQGVARGGTGHPWTLMGHPSCLLKQR